MDLKEGLAFASLGAGSLAFAVVLSAMPWFSYVWQPLPFLGIAHAVWALVMCLSGVCGGPSQPSVFWACFAVGVYLLLTTITMFAWIIFLVQFLLLSVAAGLFKTAK